MESRAFAKKPWLKESESQPEALLRGVISRVTFRNPENGYTVFKASVENEGLLTVVGTALDVRVGSYVLMRGQFGTHPKFGRQFKASSVIESIPSSSAGLARYLSSGLIKGIGEKTAKRLVAKFGEQTMEALSAKPDEVAKIPGIGKKKAAEWAKFFSARSERSEIMRFLVEHSVSTGLAERIFERYGTHSVEVLKHDPYLLAREMRGIGFLTADRIALNLGLKRDAPQRLKAGIYHALERSADDGHCYLEKPKLFEAACQLLELDPETDLNLYLEGLITEGYIVKECRFAGREALYLKHLERAEVFVAEFVAKRIEPWDERPISEHDVVTCTQRTEAEMGIKFSAEQRHAIECAASQRFLIITGGPGCGKTTVTRAIASLFFRAKKRLLLAAPTGRAAQRLAQVCDKPASTIHRLLRYDPHQGAFRHGINDPLICDGLIVDEASMLDIELAKHLFSAVPAGATLILVGDKDQLPSVGPGRVFGDLVSVSKATTISLSQLFRRSEQSHITAYAHMINAGVVPPIPEPDGRTKTDAYFISRVDPDQAASMLEKLVAEQIPKKFGFKPEEITVLTPSNRGVLGTIALNQRLQARLNPKDKLDSEQEITLGDLTLRVGDRVCQRVNNYQIDEAGVFNGDVGEIYNIDPRHKRIIVELWDGRLIKYEESDISQLSLAYAVTVHRAQGSEMPCVVLALHESHYTLLERQLLYTAVTRAKKLLVIVGSRRALMLAAKRMNAKKRCTLLKDRIEALFTH